MGYAVQDTLEFGSIKVKNQSFIIVEEASLPARRSWDGICGLGWRGLSHLRQPLYERLREQGRKAVFAMIPQGGNKASMSVGELPHNAYKENTLHYAKVESVDPATGLESKSKSFWVVEGGVAVTKKKPQNVRFLIDTGTNQVLLVPRRVYHALITSLIPPEMFTQLCGMAYGSVVVCDCAIEQKNLPPLRIYLGSNPFEFQFSELLQKVPEKNGGKDLCLLQVQPNPMMGMPLDPFGGLLGGMLGGLMDPFHAGMPAGGPRQMPDPFGGIPGGPPPPTVSQGGQLKPPQRMPDPFGGILGGPPPPRGSPLRGRGSGDGSQQAVQGMLNPLEGLIDGLEKNMSAHNPKKGDELDLLRGNGLFKPMEGVLERLEKNGPTGGMAPMQNTEEEIIEETKPDGTICRTTLIMQGGKVQKKSTRCTKAVGGETAGPARRLQMMLPPFTGPPADAQPQRPHEGGVDDLFVLGGVFLERYVTVFDFANGRIGFAQPLNPPDAVERMKTLGLAEAEVQNTSKAGVPWWVVVGGIAVLSAAGVAALHMWIRPNHSVRDATEPLDAEALECAE